MMAIVRCYLMAVAALAAASVGVSPGRAYANTAPGACENSEFRTGPFESLPDCRAYEQVTPTDKGGLDGTPDIEQEAGYISGAVPAEVSQLEGSETSVAYESAAAFAEIQSNLLPNAYLATRRNGEWKTQPVSPPSPQPSYPGVFLLNYNFTPDLSQVVVGVPLQHLAEGDSEDVVNLYSKRLSEPGYSVISGPPLSPAPPGCAECVLNHRRTFAGASEDLQRVIFEANDALVPGAPEKEVESLYESAGGKVRLAGILPDGKIPPQGSSAGAGISASYSIYFRSLSGNVRNSVSKDGTRVFFTALADGGAPDPAQEGMSEIYERLNSATTVEVSAPAANATPANPAAEPAQYWGASLDGASVYFTSTAELTTNSNTGTNNNSSALYRYNTATGELADLTVDDNPLDSATGPGVLGVAGMSSDGSAVYYVAEGRLLPGKGVAGQPNLYLSRSHYDGERNRSETVFIATLSRSDERDWTSTPTASRSYVTPDGLHMAFMSSSAPANFGVQNYSNEDQYNTGQLDSEVYEYSVRTSPNPNNVLEEGSLVCVSCDPNRQRPVGNAFIGVYSIETSLSTPFYQPRVVSDDGARVFFSSPDKLVPGLSSSLSSIYEYENGAAYLIASPSSGTNDLFLDASPSGNDVFFATRNELVASDQDNLVDIYDARVDGGLTAQQQHAEVGRCLGSTCQGPSSSPPPLLTATSEALTGGGNVAVTSSAKGGGKVLVRKRSVKKHHKRNRPVRKKVRGHRGRVTRDLYR